jgi:peptide/nickel transport system substrate-binding protein
VTGLEHPDGRRPATVGSRAKEAIMRTEKLVRGLVVACALAAALTGLPRPGAAQEQLTVLVASLGGENWLMPNTDISSLLALQPMYESLLSRDLPSGQVVRQKGRLAESWEMSPDAMTFTFNLRRGVPFHGGWGEVTADDVKFSMDLALRPDAKNPGSSYFRGQIASVEIVSPTRVVFHMKKPSIGLPIRLSEMVINLGITSKKYVESVGESAASRKPIGTGPYRFASHDFGQSIKFEAVENHWRQTPKIKTVVIRAVPNAATRLAMLKSGAADLAPIGFDDIQDIERAGLRIQALENQSLVTLLMQGQYLKPAYDPAQTPPWAQADPEKALKVRRALSLAINRKEIVDYVLHGRGRAEGACAFSFFPQNVGYNASCLADPYDPGRARQLLREAGYASPADLKLTVDLAEHPARPFGARVLEAIAQQWRTLGIGVKTQKSEWRMVSDKSAARKAIEIATYPAPAADDAAELLAYYTRSTDRESFSGESEQLDRLLNDALTAVSPEAVRKTREALFEHLYRNVTAIPVVYAHLLYAKNAKLDWPALPGSVAYYVHNYEFMSYGK